MANIDKITPAKGKVGNVAVLHGSGLTGTTFIVKFGRATSPDAGNPGNSPDNIKCTIPAKDALDPAAVAVTVTIDGTPATVAAGVGFEYAEVANPPAIASVVDVVYDAGAFTLSFGLTGTGFVTANRQPEAGNAYVVDGDPNDGVDLRTMKGTVAAGATAERMDLSFNNVRMTGVYAAVVGFSDGSGAKSPSFQVG